MTPERWRDIERLYHQARARPPQGRAAFVRDASAGDETLRAAVESLLARREEAAGFMEPPAGEPEALANPAPDGPTDLLSNDAARPLRFFQRWPWWVWCCSLPLLVAAGGLLWTILSGPEPAGWTLAVVRGARPGIAWRVVGIEPGSAAERAGFEMDAVVADADLQRFLANQRPHGVHRFDVVREGQSRTLTLAVGAKDWSYWFGDQGALRLVAMLNAALYLALAGILIFSRPHDRTARWGALLITQLGFELLLIATGASYARFDPETAYALRALPLPVGVMVLGALSLSLMVPAGAFAFCAVFPRPLPVSNHLWWLFLLAPAVTISIDLDRLWLPVYGGPAQPTLPGFLFFIAAVLGFGFLMSAVVLLVRNYRRLEDANERRRLRIVALGFGLSLFAMAVGMLLATPWAPIEEFRRRYWAGSVRQLAHAGLFAAAPMCAAYAILRHRVFDIHVIVRLGLRYAAARGVLLSIVPATGLILAVDVLIHRGQAVTEIAGQRGWLYLALGFGALALHVKRKAWMDALDRRFFRERYDAHRLLSGVVDDVRRSAGFEEAARHVIARIDRALHPESVSLMIRHPGEPVYHTVAATNGALRSMPADARLIALARVLDKPLQNPQSGTGWLQEQLPRGETEFLRRARVEWLFPVLLRESGTEAFLLLGPKRSEEPYSREDRGMLTAIAASLALLLERPAAPASAAGFSECAECGTCYDSGPARCAGDGGTLLKWPYSRTLAGRYRLDRRLGRGGMGSVYEAADTLLERRVAVKVIRAEWMASADAVARFRREAKAAASFSHAHVVTVHDFGVADDGRAYLVMERLEGRNLREELASGRVEPKRALDILRGVSAAVTTAHQHRLLHRDLKPENVFLARSDDGEVAKVLDFGLVKPLGSARTESLTATAPGELIGTLAYMSPEQLAGGAPAESWDIWALAVMAFEMLTGVRPFAVSGDPRSTFAGSRDGACDPVMTATLSAPLTAFFERSLSPERTRRPTSVRQFIEELEAAL